MDTKIHRCSSLLYESTVDPPYLQVPYLRIWRAICTFFKKAGKNVVLFSQTQNLGFFYSPFCSQLVKSNQLTNPIDSISTTICFHFYCPGSNSLKNITNSPLLSPAPPATKVIFLKERFNHAILLFIYFI